MISRRTSLQLFTAQTLLMGLGWVAPARAAGPTAPAKGSDARAVTVTYLQSQPTRLAQLERFVGANWFAMDEQAVQQGLFVSYEWLDTGTDEGEWNAIVVVTYADHKGFEGIQERWAKIRAAHQEVRPDGLGMKELGRVLETKNLFERAPFATKRAALASLP